MGWFNSPAIMVRKLVPESSHPAFNAVEEFAQAHLRMEPDHQKPYQLGIVLAAWAKAGIMAGELAISPRNAAKIQAISDSSVKVLKSESFTAFHVLARLAEEDGIFGVPADVFTRISFDAAGYR